MSTWFAENPVAVNLRCEDCKSTMSAPWAPAVLLEMWFKAHEGHLISNTSVPVDLTPLSDPGTVPEGAAGAVGPVPAPSGTISQEAQSPQKKGSRR